MGIISNEEADYGYAQYQDFKMQQEELGYHAGEQQDEDILTSMHSDEELIFLLLQKGGMMSVSAVKENE
jgi:hypothetical protein